MLLTVLLCQSPNQDFNLDLKQSTLSLTLAGLFSKIKVDMVGQLFKQILARAAAYDN